MSKSTAGTEAHPLRWSVSQIGARQHYGVPRGFHYKGHLRCLYTDIWSAWGGSFSQTRAPRLRALAGRYHRDLPSDKIVAFSLSSILSQLRGDSAEDVEQQYEFYRRFGARFAQKVTAHLKRQSLEPASDCFFGFNTGCLETLEYLRQKNVVTVVDQIDPARVEEDLVLRETEKWPGWQKATGRIPQAYYKRLASEWELATLVLVNSNWSKNALIVQGVPAQKLVVMPVAFEPPAMSTLPRPLRNGPLRVLWFGTVNLRKGIQYLVEAARKLIDLDIQFTIAGPIAISRDAVRSAPKNIKFVGQISRDKAREFYRTADVFVLPTISDGFAITQVEAMAEGLPVVTTPNCGEVVTHGLDGVIVPAGNSDALAAALITLNDRRDLLAEMSYFATRKSKTFHLPRQADEIEREILTRLSAA